MRHFMRNTLSFKKDLLLTVITPLIVGATIYFLTRPHSIKFLRWVDTTFQISSFKSLTVPSWIKFNLPDGLWTFAFLSFILIIWQRQIHICNAGWIMFPIAIAIILEFFYGTFDPLDICAIIVASFLSLLHPKNKYFLTIKHDINVQN